MEKTSKNIPQTNQSDSQSDNNDDLGNKSDGLFESKLSGTTQAFSNRIQRKIQEKEKQDLVSGEATKDRHNLLLKALLTIRRSLTDVTRIDLGERFCFSLFSDDSNGWPRFTISLNDNIMRAAHYPTLQVLANDRLQQATIEIKYDINVAPLLVNLNTEGDLSKMPSLLKKAVRSYLDLIGELILQAEQNSIELTDSKNLMTQIQQQEIAESKEECAEDDDFLSEDAQEVLESLPELEDINYLNIDDEF